MAGVEVVDGDPVEPCSEVLLHLLHDIAGEGAKVAQPVAVLGRDDEAELVPILAALIQKGAAVGSIGLRPIQPPLFSFPVGPVPLSIA
jgi:hypothetical protein